MTSRTSSGNLEDVVGSAKRKNKAIVLGGTPLLPQKRIKSGTKPKETSLSLQKRPQSIKHEDSSMLPGMQNTSTGNISANFQISSSGLNNTMNSVASKSSYKPAQAANMSHSKGFKLTGGSTGAPPIPDPMNEKYYKTYKMVQSTLERKDISSTISNTTQQNRIKVNSLIGGGTNSQSSTNPSFISKAQATGGITGAPFSQTQPNAISHPNAPALGPIRPHHSRGLSQTIGTSAGVKPEGGMMDMDKRSLSLGGDNFEKNNSLVVHQTDTGSREQKVKVGTASRKKRPVVPSGPKTLLFIENINRFEHQLPPFEAPKTVVKDFDKIRSFSVNTHQGIVRPYNEDRVSILLNAHQRYAIAV